MTRTAVHEAGHCVIARTVGHTVRRVVLYPDGSGMTETAPVLHGDEVRAARESLLVVLAGPVAEERVR